MSWLIVFLIGLAVGWAVELILDLWFWGRRLRGVEARMRACRSDLRAAEYQLAETQAAISQYQSKEGEYQKCQKDLGHLAEQHSKIQVLTKQMTNEISASKTYAENLGVEIEDLKTERDGLSVHLEDVGRWIESTFRERIWGRGLRQAAPAHQRKSTVAHARSMAATSTQRIGRAARKLRSGANQVKERLSQTIKMARGKRLLNTGRCAVWTLISKVYKKSTVPTDCNIAKSQ